MSWPFKLRALDKCLMKLGVVHSPCWFWFSIEIPWIVTAQIWSLLPLFLIYFYESLASCNCFELRWDLIGGDFLLLLLLSCFDNLREMSFSLSLLSLCSWNFFCLNLCLRLWHIVLTRCSFFLYSKWSLFEENILNIIVALSRPPIHLFLQVFLLGYVLSNC